MSSNGSPKMHRSTSMPVQPQPLPMKTMKRSQEKETLYEEDYYPESPSCERRRKSRIDEHDRIVSHSHSDNNITLADWAGSTIELNTDLRRNEIDAFYQRRKPYRVVEKNGRENVIFKKIPEKSWRYIRDFVTTLVRFFLPKRFLMNTKNFSSSSSTSASAPNLTTVNTNNEISSISVSPHQKEEESERGDNNDNEKIDNGISEIDGSTRENRRVKFSLFD